MFFFYFLGGIVLSLFCGWSFIFPVWLHRTLHAVSGQYPTGRLSVFIFVFPSISLFTPSAASSSRSPVLIRSVQWEEIRRSSLWRRSPSTTHPRTAGSSLRARWAPSKILSLVRFFIQTDTRNRGFCSPVNECLVQFPLSWSIQCTIWGWIWCAIFSVDSLCSYYRPSRARDLHFW